MAPLAKYWGAGPPAPRTNAPVYHDAPMLAVLPTVRLSSSLKSHAPTVDTGNTRTSNLRVRITNLVALTLTLSFIPHMRLSSRIAD